MWRLITLDDCVRAATVLIENDVVSKYYHLALCTATCSLA